MVAKTLHDVAEETFDELVVRTLHVVAEETLDELVVMTFPEVAGCVSGVAEERVQVVAEKTDGLAGCVSVVVVDSRVQVVELPGSVMAAAGSLHLILYGVA